MLTHTMVLKRKGAVVVSTLLFGWMVLNSSTTALADKRRDDWNRRSRFSASSNCRNDSRRDSRFYQRNNYYQRDGYTDISAHATIGHNVTISHTSLIGSGATTAIRVTTATGMIAVIGDTTSVAPVNLP